MIRKRLPIMTQYNTDILSTFHRAQTGKKGGILPKMHWKQSLAQRKRLGGKRSDGAGSGQKRCGEGNGRHPATASTPSRQYSAVGVSFLRDDRRRREVLVGDVTRRQAENRKCFPVRREMATSSGRAKCGLQEIEKKKVHLDFRKRFPTFAM